MINETLTDNQGPMFKDDDPKSAVLLPESKESRSEYKGGDDFKSKSESDAEPAEGPEFEDEEPDTRIQLKAGKKQKKGLVARDQISATVVALNDLDEPYPSLRVAVDSECSERAAASKT
jgi:hypothetical protein